MRLTGYEDLRVRKTITAIRKAFEELICEKDYERIRVSEICALSMVNKKTFYHYYPTLDALLAELQEELSSEYVELVRDYRLPEDLEKVNRAFFEYSASKGLAYDRITCSTGSYRPIRQEMIDQVTEQTWGKSEAFLALPPMERTIILSYIRSVCVGCYREWVNDGKRMPLEEIITLSGKLLCGGLNRVFETKGE